MFVDKSKVFAALDRKQKRIIARTGGFTMQSMRRSMRYSRKVSLPGRPPNARRNNPLLREHTYFGIEPNANAVVVGPLHFNVKVRTFGLTVSSKVPVPQLLNEGGLATLIDHKHKVTRAHYNPRPFTPPAFEAGAQKLIELTEQIPL